MPQDLFPSQEGPAFCNLCQAVSECQLFRLPSPGQGITSQAGDAQTAEGAALGSGPGVSHQKPTLLPAGAWSPWPDDRDLGVGEAPDAPITHMFRIGSVCLTKFSNWSGL